MTREPNATVARIAIFAAASCAGDVLRRVGLREAEPLRLGERLVVARAALHLGEDEVGRAVDDPEHAVDVRDDERLAQHLDHRESRRRRRPRSGAGRRASAAAAKSSAPRRATSCLLAVTTGFPARSSSST